MSREELYLQDIIEAANAIEKFITNVSEENFVADELLQSAVLYKLTIVGEAAVRVSTELKNRHPDIKWKQIVGFRNIVVHAYFSVNWKTVWTAATEDVVTLKQQIQEILQTDFPDFELRAND